MPTVNKLASNKGNKTPVASDTATPSAAFTSDPHTAEREPVNTPPLAPNTPVKASTPGQLTLPSFLQQSAMPETIEQEMTGFVGFASSASKKNWPNLSAAGCTEGMAYVSKDGSIIPLPNGIKFFLLKADSFQTQFLSDGSFSFVTRDLELEGPTTAKLPNGAVVNAKTEAHYIGLLIVELPNGTWIPIKGDFRGTKSNGLSGPINAVKAAASPSWASDNGNQEAYRLAAAFPHPFGRVFHHVTTQMYVGKGTGNTSYPAKAQSKPASLTQMQKLNELFTDESFLSTLNEANKNFDARVKFFDDRIAEQNKAA